MYNYSRHNKTPYKVQGPEGTRPSVNPPRRWSKQTRQDTTRRISPHKQTKSHAQAQAHTKCTLNRVDFQWLQFAKSGWPVRSWPSVSCLAQHASTAKTMLLWAPQCLIPDMQSCKPMCTATLGKPPRPGIEPGSSA